jgi:hypothetical protein
MMPFDLVTGTAAPMLAPNIDTDVIMPKMFLKGVDRSGLGEGAFNLLRFQRGQAQSGVHSESRGLPRRSLWSVRISGAGRAASMPFGDCSKSAFAR